MKTLIEVNEIAHDHITVADVVLPCEWSISSTGRSVFAFYEIDGEQFRVAFTGECGEFFTAAMNAARRCRRRLKRWKVLSRHVKNWMSI